ASIAFCRRPILTSLSLSANGWLLKPRFGRRRCSGIWPPSKPLMRTPERAVWPLPPRPPVLPLPEPMPRPMRMRALRAPALSEISCSFITLSSCRTTGTSPAIAISKLLALDHAHQMLNLGDHAARLRGIGQFRNAADAVEAEADQRLALGMVTADRASD